MENAQIDDAFPLDNMNKKENRKEMNPREKGIKRKGEERREFLCI